MHVLCMLRGFSHILLFVTLRSTACQALLSMHFSGQEYWSGIPCLPPGDLPNPGIKPLSPGGRVFSSEPLVKLLAPYGLAQMPPPLQVSLTPSGESDCSAIRTFIIQLFYYCCQSVCLLYQAMDAGV